MTPMTLTEIMQELKALGTEQTKKTFIRHGATDLFGVKIGDLKKLVKYVKKDQQLALDLYATGNSDAMYLAGLAVDPKQMTKEQLQSWACTATWYATAESVVANVAAESKFAVELAREWITSDCENIATAGWSTYTNYLSITPDDQIDFPEVAELLTLVSDTIHRERNRVRYTMNGFVIGVGTFTIPLHGDARAIAETIGAVKVDVGDTSCKVPFAPSYLDKVETMGRIGYKKKTCIC